ncbi:MAG: hypothetical protein LBI53_06420 [Candidatus Peribacteria bacterium]|jgi:hypothetical protein|nr:hypothetical protein [Candidatus Peribacteria bacterium]
MKKLIFGSIGILCCLQGWGWTQQEEISLIEELTPVQEESSCHTPFILEGAEYAFIGETLHYTLEFPLEENSDSISYTLQFKDGNKLIQKAQNQSLQITFGEIGSFVLFVDIIQGDCSYTLEKNISVFEKAVVYIGEPQEAFQL